LISTNNEENFPVKLGALPSSAEEMVMKPKEIAAPETPSLDEIPF
jgi:hypothetical protein